MCRAIEEIRRQERAEGWIEDWKEGWIEGWKEGWKEGRQEGIEESSLAFIQNLMQSMNWPITQAMDVLKVPEDKRKHYQNLLEKR